MTAVYILIFIAAWLACGVFGAGQYFAYFQRRFPTIRAGLFKSHKEHAVICIFFGPIGVSAAYMEDTYGYGWLWPWSAKARREAGIDGRVKP